MSAAELFTDERAVRGTSAPVMGMVLFVAGEAMLFAAFFRSDTLLPVYAASTVSKPLPSVSKLTGPAEGAVQRHHTERPPGCPA